MSHRQRFVRNIAIALSLSVVAAGIGCGDSSQKVDDTGRSQNAQATTAPSGTGGVADPMLSADTQRTLTIIEENKAAPAPRRPVSPAYDRQRGPAGIETQPRGNVGRR